MPTTEAGYTYAVVPNCRRSTRLQTEEESIYGHSRLTGQGLCGTSFFGYVFRTRRENIQYKNQETAMRTVVRRMRTAWNRP